MAEKNPELQKQAAPGDIAIKGAVTKTDLERPAPEPGARRKTGGLVGSPLPHDLVDDDDTDPRLA